jgi:hypothetical protein
MIDRHSDNIKKLKLNKTLCFMCSTHLPSVSQHMLLEFDFTQAQGNHSLDTLFRVFTLQRLMGSTDFWFQIDFL